MKLYVFEGSPEEIGAVYKQMDRDSSDPVMIEQAVDKGSKPALPLGGAKPSSKNGKKEFVGEKFARAAITRLELSAPLRAVLIKLYNAQSDWVPVAELYKASGYDGAQFAGLMGAFGRRMKHTYGYDADAYFFDFDWDDNTSAWRYRLPESVKEAMRAAGIV